MYASGSAVPETYSKLFVVILPPTINLFIKNHSWFPPMGRFQRCHFMSHRIESIRQGYLLALSFKILARRSYYPIKVLVDEVVPCRSFSPFVLLILHACASSTSCNSLTLHTSTFLYNRTFSSASTPHIRIPLHRLNFFKTSRRMHLMVRNTELAVHSASFQVESAFSCLLIPMLFCFARVVKTTRVSSDQQSADAFINNHHFHESQKV